MSFIYKILYPLNVCRFLYERPNSVWVFLFIWNIYGIVQHQFTRFDTENFVLLPIKIDRVISNPEFDLQVDSGSCCHSFIMHCSLITMGVDAYVSY